MLPRYVVNLNEGIPYFVPNIESDTSIEFKEGKQRSKGLRLKVRDGYGTASWRVDRPILLTGINIHADYGSQINPHKYKMDTLDIYVEDKKIFSEKPIYDVTNYTNIRNFLVANPNLEIRFDYSTNTLVGEVEEDKDIWIDVDYLGDSVLKAVKIYCIRKGGSHLVEKDILKIVEYEISRGVYDFNAPEVEGYTPLFPHYNINAIPLYDSHNNSVPIVRVLEYARGVRK